MGRTLGIASAFGAKTRQLAHILNGDYCPSDIVMDTFEERFARSIENTVPHSRCREISRWPCDRTLFAIKIRCDRQVRILIRTGVPLVGCDEPWVQKTIELVENLVRFISLTTLRRVPETGTGKQKDHE